MSEITAVMEKPARNGRSAAGGGPDRLPPHASEAEQGVLGCLLYASESAGEVFNTCQESGMEPKWFYDLRHQILYATLAGMITKGTPVDLLTVMTRLKGDETLEQCSGVEYLNVLQDCVPSAANVAHYLETVREQWQRRQLIAACSDLVGRAFESSTHVEALMAQAEREITALVQPSVRAKERHIREVLPEVIDELENYHKGKVQLQGLPTGFDYLDKVIGGIGNDWYWVLAGRPGSGKTTLALDVINYLTTDYVWWEKKADTGSVQGEGATEPELVRRQGIPIGIFSLEMSSKSLGKRLLFSMARVSAGKFKQGFMSNGDFQKLITATPKLAGANIYLDEEPKQSIGKIRAKAMRMARQYGIKLFVLDYLQLVMPDQRSNRVDRVQELADISSEIVYLKKKLGIPWLVLAQMNRNIETAERVRVPVLSDLKDCGCIEQDADVVQFLHKPGHKEVEEDEGLLAAHYDGVEFSERPRRIDAVVAKNRDGATGIAKLLFHCNQFHFEDWRKWQVAQGYATGSKGESYKSPIADEDVPEES